MRASACSVVLLAALLLTTSLQAAGTLTVAATTVSPALTRYALTWVSTAGGAVSANLFDVRPGELVQVKFVPNSGGTQPTDLYDVTLVDENSVDLLAGGGANLSNATSTIKVPSFGATTLYRYVHDGLQRLDLVVANAGNAKGGTIYLWIR